MEQNIIAVSQVNEYIKFLLDRDELLANLCVRGEISNYKVYPSGHHYFTLKDAEGALRCVMFRSSAQRLRFKPENGMQVVAYGRVTVFPRDGAYQLYCSDVTPDGVGDLYVTVYGGRTRLVGILLGRGLDIDEAKAELNGVTLESLVVAVRVARAVRIRAQRGELKLSDFPMLMHVDDILSHHAPVNIPWEQFTFIQQ